MEKEIFQFINLLKNSANILLVTHQKPDGDAIGSLLSFGTVLEKLKKKKTLVAKDLSIKYKFLPRFDQIKEEINQLKEFDLCIILDCGQLSQTGFPILTNLSIPLVNIDHHFTNSCWGDINLVQKDSSATCEILYNLFQFINEKSDLPIKIDKDIATYLLLGISTDTGSFKHSNTTLKTLRIASKLLLKGGKLLKISKEIYNIKSLSTLKLWGKVFSNISYNKKFKIVISVITKKDFKECGATSEDLEGAIYFLNAIPEAKAILLLSEQNEKEIKGSLRTENEKIDVSKLARFFNGGGHKKAAGFVIKGSLLFDGKRWKVV